MHQSQTQGHSLTNILVRYQPVKPLILVGEKVFLVGSPFFIIFLCWDQSINLCWWIPLFEWANLWLNSLDSQTSQTYFTRSGPLLISTRHPRLQGLSVYTAAAVMTSLAGGPVVPMELEPATLLTGCNNGVSNGYKKWLEATLHKLGYNPLYIVYIIIYCIQLENYSWWLALLVPCYSHFNPIRLVCISSANLSCRWWRHTSAVERPGWTSDISMF